MKNKAHIFTKEEIGEFVRNDTHSLRSILGVRKALVIIAFFGEHGGHELGSGKKISIGQEGVYVVHECAKQRSDQQSSRLYSI